MPVSTGPVTLGDLIHEDELLWVYCRECCHERDVNLANVPLPGPKGRARNREADEVLQLRLKGSLRQLNFIQVASTLCGGGRSRPVRPSRTALALRIRLQSRVSEV